MKLTLAEPKYLKDSMAIISELVNEARLHVTANSVELVAMDPANVAMVVFKLMSTAFSDYQVSEDTEIGINLNNLKQILKRAKPSDSLNIEVEESKLKIQLKGNATRTFFIPIIELEERDQKIPDLNFAVTATTACANLTEAIEDVDVVGESVAFRAMKGKLTIASEGDLSKAKVELVDSEETKVSSKSEEEVRAKYSIEYLKKMVGGSKLTNNVVLNFNKDYPLKLEFKAADKMLLSFILAPRVEND